MRTQIKQAGFSAVELVIVLAVVGVLGAVGFSVYSRQNTMKADSAASSASPATINKAPIASDVATAPNISTVSDLDKASTMLDQTNPDGSNNADASELDTELADF